MLMYYCVCVCAASQRLLMNQMPPIAFFLHCSSDYIHFICPLLSKTDY